MRRALAIALTFGTNAAAQQIHQSAAISNVAYEIIADSVSVGRHQLGVSMTFDVSGTAPVVLALPAWSPGHYVLLWFARRVSNFAPQQNGAPLDWRKLDFQTWEIKPRGAGQGGGTFQYLANAVDRAVAWTAPNFAFFTGSTLFLYPTLCR